MKYKLSEIFDSPISGEWGTELQEGQQGYKVIRTTNFTNQGRLNLSDIVSRNIDIDKCSKKVLQVGDIIIEKSGGSPNQPVGRVVFFDVTEDEYYFCNNFTAILRPKEFVYPKYGLYLMKMLYIQRKVLKFQNKTTGIINLKLNDYLNQTSINLPSFETQERIANILDQAQELIDKRKAQIEALDELIQSVFYDMFGDPIQNPKGFNKKAIGKEFEIKTGATPSRKDETYWDNGTIPWVKTTELKEVVIYDTDECITELGFNNSSVNLLPKNTLLIAMYGQGKTRGMTGKLGIEATTNQACAALLPTDKNNQDFIWIQLRCLYEELRNLGRGGNQPNLNTNLIKSFEILFPPIELQNQFAEIVASIQKQKELLNESLVELENNFNSLMQRAFKGELF